MRYLPMICVFLLAACNEAPAVTTAEATPVSIVRRDIDAVPTITKTQIDTAQTALRAEPKVLDLVYDPQAVVQWTIGVKDDGTERYGYAEYVCLTLKDMNALAPGVEVRIVDYPAFMANGGDAHAASLGHVECDGHRHLRP